MRAIATMFFFLGTALTSTADAQPGMTFLPAGQVKPDGWIRKQMELDLSEGLTGNYHKVSNAVNLQVFEKQDRQAGGFVEIPGEKRQKSWWSGEHEGYWKDSIVRMAFLVDDPAQKRPSWINWALMSSMPSTRTALIGIAHHKYK